MPDIGKAYIQIVPSAQGIQGSITKALSGEGAAAGTEDGKDITGSLIPSLEGLGSLGGAGLAKALIGAFVGFGVASKLKDVISEGLTAGGALEQSLGGVEAIFGDSADKVKKYAEESWRTVGVSANEYMEGVTGFSAALINSMSGDTERAADVANMAFMDMGDNANRFGTDMQSIQAAYQGFAKQNYTMLDNLKLGYGGTKTEMERLLADATKLSGVEYNIDNLGDVYEAIHVIQEELNVTGTTANEAMTTLQGSAAAMGAAWTDLLGNMALGENIGPSLQNLAAAVSAWLFDNLIPMVVNILSSLPEMIFGIVSGIGSELLVRLPEIFATVGEGLSSALTGLITAITTYVPMFLQGFVDLFFTAMNALGQIDWLGIGTNLITWIWDGINALIDIVPNLLLDIGSQAVDFVTNIDWAKVGTDIITFIFNAINSLFDNIPNILQSIGDTAVRLVTGIDWLGLGSSIIDFIVGGISALFENMPNTLQSIGQTAWDLVSGIDWLGLGIDVINFIVEGIGGLFDSIPETLESIAQTAWDWASEVDWLGLGSAIVSGIIDGLWAFGAGIADTLVQLAADAWSAAKSWLGIGSPSKLFRNTVGRWIPPGIAEGIESTKDVALDAMADLNNDISNSMDVGSVIGMNGQVLNGAIKSGVGSPNYQIVVEAEMDGTPIRTSVGNYIIRKISNDELNAARFQGAGA